MPQEARWPYIAGPLVRPVPGPAGVPGPVREAQGTPGAGAGWGRDPGAGTWRDPGQTGPPNSGRRAGPARPPAAIGPASASGPPPRDAAGGRRDNPASNAGNREDARTGWPMVGYATAPSFQPGGFSGPGRHSDLDAGRGGDAAETRPAGPEPAPGSGEDASRSASASRSVGTGQAAATGWPGYPPGPTAPPGTPAGVPVGYPPGPAVTGLGSAAPQRPASPAAPEPAAAAPAPAGPGTSAAEVPGPEVPGPEVPGPEVPSPAVPGPQAPAPQASAPRRPPPVVIVSAQRSVAGPSQAAPARQQAAPGVERALSGSGDRTAGWRSHVSVVPGGRGPGRPDHVRRARERAVQPLDQPRLVVVLGCTVGAGQTVTTLILADLLAGLRGEPVAAVDLNPGPASLTELARVPAIAVSALLADRAPGAHAANGQDRGLAPARGSRARGRLDVICQDAAPDGAALPNLQHDRLVSVLASRYLLTLVDPGAPAVARLLAEAGQLVLIAPASPDAARAVSMRMSGSAGTATPRWPGVPSPC